PADPGRRSAGLRLACFVRPGRRNAGTEKGTGANHSLTETQCSRQPAEKAGAGKQRSQNSRVTSRKGICRESFATGCQARVGQGANPDTECRGGAEKGF